MSNSLDIWYNKYHSIYLKGRDDMRNQKGFSLLELMAVIILATTVLVPMLSGLIGNFEVNKRMHTRKAASSITLTTISAMDKVYFDNFANAYILRPLTEEPIVEITQEDCPDFTENEPSDYFVMDSNAVCDMIFTQQWNSIQFNEPGTFRIYLYPYYLSESQINDILALEDIPERVLSEVDSINPTDPDTTDEDVFRVTVWIQYDQETEQDIVSSGVITRE